MTQGCEQQNLSADIVQRFSREVERIALPISELARQIGEPQPQRIRDVLRGKTRLPADMLARAAAIGIDPLYVITGERTTSPVNPRERALLDNYRSASRQEKTHLEQAGLSKARPANALNTMSFMSTDPGRL